jgi:hypothetical protein
MIRTLLLFFFLAAFTKAATAQDSDRRAQYPGLLANSYFSVNLGFLQIPFSAAQLEPGHTVESISVPPIALRAVLFGHQFNKYLSAQVSYMRPVTYAAFRNIDGVKGDHYVWMHYGSLTVKSQLPLSRRLSLAAEAGLGIVTRKGFSINGQTIVRSGSYETVFLGGGLEYHLNRKWDLLAGVAYTPSNADLRQPRSLYYSAGFRLNMRPLTPEQVARNASGGYIFPKHLIQVGFTTNAFGYGPNNFLSKKVPIFWGGGIELEKGLTVRYQRNLFHTRKVFAFNVGVSASWWQSRKNRESFYSLALAPIFQFNVVRAKPFDLYLFYSLAGPSYLSQVVIDGEKSGKNFTFQDFMGFGIFTGKKRQINAEININHYSNGNIFTENAGLKIPMTFTVGYAF